MPVGIGTGRTAAQGKVGSIYSPDFYTTTGFLDAIECLKRCGFIFTNGSFTSPASGKPGRTRRYRLSQDVIDRLAAAGAKLACLSRTATPSDGIVLRSTKEHKKKPIEYHDTANVISLRMNLSLINGVLSDHWVDLDITTSEFQLNKDDMQHYVRLLKEEIVVDSEYSSLPFDLSARTLYRIFNNASFEVGGRFYGAWWQSIRSDRRKHVTIDGKRTCEVDYSGLHAAILFAEEGLCIPDDPYTRCMEGSSDVALRRLVKRTFNALLNASSVEKLKKIDGFDEALTGKNWTSFKKSIVDAYPEFHSHFGTGAGFRLQYIDSQLAESVMLHFAKMGYACLPVHDSFLVHHDLKDELIDAMRAAFRMMYGTDIPVKSKDGLITVTNGHDPINRSTSDIELYLNNDVEGPEKRLMDFIDFKSLRSKSSDQR